VTTTPAAAARRFSPLVLFVAAQVVLALVAPSVSVSGAGGVDANGLPVGSAPGAEQLAAEGAAAGHRPARRHDRGAGRGGGPRRRPRCGGRRGRHHRSARNQRRARQRRRARSARPGQRGRCRRSGEVRSRRAADRPVVLHAPVRSGVPRRQRWHVDDRSHEEGHPGHVRPRAVQPAAQRDPQAARADHRPGRDLRRAEHLQEDAREALGALRPQGRLGGRLRQPLGQGPDRARAAREPTSSRAAAASRRRTSRATAPRPTSSRR
jgi:hypothetical protein